jgi:endonuclease/exonuclease/phosphatase (EEP) superfamily protein YafD
MLSLVNVFAVYLFLPSIPLLIFAVLRRSRPLLLGCAATILLFLYLWQPRWLWPLPAPSSPDTTITVMTYNLLGLQSETEPAIRTIRREGADLVALQELNAGMSQALATGLRHEYPYRILAPRIGTNGRGIFSKHPLTELQHNLPGNWPGRPLIARVRWQDCTLTIVNFHLWPSRVNQLSGSELARVARRREEQARILDRFVDEESRRNPIILAGDANTTELSDAYRILTRHLDDAWRSAGFGFGHTFPGSSVPGSSRPRIFGISVPRWLVRIDFIFHSPSLVPVRARTVKHDGVSDHRPVLATFTVSPNRGDADPESASLTAGRSSASLEDRLVLHGEELTEARAVLCYSRAGPYRAFTVPHVVCSTATG